MSATQTSLSVLSQLATSQIESAMTAAVSTEQPDPSSAALVQAWTPLLHVRSAEQLEDVLTALQASAVPGVHRVIDTARVVAGQILRPDDSAADPLSTPSWSEQLHRAELCCPRCGRGELTGSTWPRCTRHGSCDIWCDSTRVAEDKCAGCVEHDRSCTKDSCCG